MDRRDRTIVASTLTAVAVMGLLVALLCIYYDIGVPSSETGLLGGLDPPDGTNSGGDGAVGEVGGGDGPGAGAGPTLSALAALLLTNPNVSGIVNEGPFVAYDITPCETGELPSCFFQNPATPYARPAWRLELPSELASFLDLIPMLPQDVVVLSGLVPYKCVYWSFIPYAFNAPTQCGNTTVVAAGLSDSISNITTGWEPSTPFTILMGMNAGAIAAVRASLPASQTQVATLQFPFMGRNALYWIIGRTTLFENESEAAAYVENTRIAATMVRLRANTIKPTETLMGIENQVFKPLNTEIDEAEVVPQSAFELGAEEFLRSVIDRLKPGYTATEIPVELVPPGVRGYESGATCVAQCANCQVNNRDTVYFGCNVQDLSPGQYLAVYAVNHATFGKAIYSSISVYELANQFGIDSVEALPGGPETYQVLIAQTTDAPRLEQLPNGTVLIKVEDNVRSYGIAERAYVQPAAPTNPSFGVSADPSTLLPMKVWLLLP